MVAGLLTVAEGNRDVAVRGGRGLAPDDDVASRKAWELRGRDMLLFEVAAASELVGGLVGRVAVEESSDGGIDGIGNSGVAVTIGTSGSSDGGRLVGESVTLGREIHKSKTLLLNVVESGLNELEVLELIEVNEEDWLSSDILIGEHFVLL